MQENYKILVVDDDMRLRALLERYLTEQGFQVRSVANAEQMDRLLTRESFHLMVLDLMLPGEDGLSICRRLRSQSNPMPIIMVTAKGEEVDRIVGLEIGADDYIPKPFNPRELLGTGEELGMSFSYKIQENPNGLAQAFVLGAEFLDGGPGCLILGDNMFYGQGFSAMLKRAASIDKGACIFGYYVKDPRAYGVVEFDANGKAVSLEEKPANPKSNYAVPGLYFYDSTVTEKAASLKPSARGEYEITDLNRLYLDEGTLKVELFGRGFAWLDTGNCDSLLEASNFVATIQNRQGFRVSCIEEIAWRKGWIDVDQLYRLGEQLGKTEYGKYLMELAESKR